MAAQMGVQLRRHDGGKAGWHDHAPRTISTRRGMAIELYRSTLAHELGHAHYGQLPLSPQWSTPSRSAWQMSTPPGCPSPRRSTGARRSK